MNSTKQINRALGLWLFLCAAVVYLMVIVGGITRLTQSGLSMVEWAPIMGVIPPLNETAWLDVFAKYKLSPEYQKINYGMTLGEFKYIFYWEYGHRVLGRLIGLIYLLPLLIFWIKGWVPKPWRGKLIFLFFLGGLQGLLGWYMVKSGLVDNPHVSQYRLTAHLGLAVVIFIFMFWYAMDFLRGQSTHTRFSPMFKTYTALSVATIFLMILSGGFVAGTKAGFILNTFPTMGGEWIPSQLNAMQPWWRNLFENPVAVQFVHRCMAVVVIAIVLTTLIKSRRESVAHGAGFLLFFLVLQVSFGITALLLVVPLWAGAGHQAGSIALLASSLYLAHSARKD